MHTAPLHYDPVSTAQRLTALDAAMREEHPHRSAVMARVSFFESAVRLFALRRLSRLGALAALSRLSERSLDLVFEDRRYAGDVVTRIVAIAERDRSFRQALIDQVGAAALEHWRAAVARDLYGRALAA